MTEPVNDTEGGPSVQVVCFVIDGALYALDIMRIKEIIRPVPITRVPMAPSFVEGIVELRGAFLPLIDLRRRFGMEPRAVGPGGDHSKYVIVGLEGRIVGLAVDDVADRRQIAESEIRPPPPLGMARHFFAGVVKSEGEVVMVLDLDAILSDAEKDQLRGMESAQA